MTILKLAAVLLALFLLVACSETPQSGEDKAGTDAAASEGSPQFEADFESGDTSEWSDEAQESGDEEPDADEADEGGGADESPDP